MKGIFFKRFFSLQTKPESRNVYKLHWIIVKCSMIEMNDIIQMMRIKLSICKAILDAHKNQFRSWKWNAKINKIYWTWSACSGSQVKYVVSIASGPIADKFMLLLSFGNTNFEIVWRSKVTRSWSFGDIFKFSLISSDFELWVRHYHEQTITESDEETKCANTSNSNVKCK